MKTTSNRFSSRIRSLLLLLIAIGLFYTGFSGDSYVLIGMGSHLRVLLTVALILLIALSVGWVVARRFFAKAGGEPSENECSLYQNYATTLLIAEGLGLGIVSIAMFFLGAIQLYNAVAVHVLLAAMAFAGRGFWIENLGLLRSLRNSSSLDSSWIPKSFILIAPLCFVLIVFNLAIALLPPSSYDALEYHLGVQSAYIMHGGFYRMPYNVFSNFPMGTEMLYGLGMLIGGDRTPQVLHALMGLMTAAIAGLIAMTGFGTVRERAKVFLFSVLIFLGLPLVLSSSGQANVDLAVAFFASAAVLAYLRLSDCLGWKKFFTVGLLAGMALATKYTSAIMVCLPMALVMVFSADPKALGRARRLVLFGVGALVPFLPWAGKNMLFQGNPVFPLLYSVLGGNWDADAAKVFMNAVAPRLAQGTAPMMELGGRLRGLLGGDSGFGFGTVAIGLCGSLFLLRDRKVKVLWSFGLVSFLVWLILTHWQYRFTLTFFPVLVALAVMGVQRQSLWTRKTLTSIMLAMVVVNLWVMLVILSHVNALAYLSGQMDAQEWRMQKLPHFVAIDYLNENLDPEVHKVIMIAEARTHGLKIPNQASTVFDRNYFMDLTDSPDPKEDLQRLRREGFSHVLYNGFEMQRLEQSYSGYGWEQAPKIRKRLEWLSPYFQEVFRIGRGEQSVVIYRTVK